MPKLVLRGPMVNFMYKTYRFRRDIREDPHPDNVIDVEQADSIYLRSHECSANFDVIGGVTIRTKEDAEAEEELERVGDGKGYLDWPVGKMRKKKDCADWALRYFEADLDTRKSLTELNRICLRLANDKTAAENPGAALEV